MAYAICIPKVPARYNPQGVARGSALAQGRVLVKSARKWLVMLFDSTMAINITVSELRMKFLDSSMNLILEMGHGKSPFRPTGHE